MKTEIRLATEADIPQLCELLDLLFSQEAEFTPDRAAQTRGLGMIIRNPHIGSILVLTDGGKVSGMVNLLFSISTALGAPVAWLEDLILAPACRAQGFGGQLINAAFAHARERGCQRITLLTDHDNQAGQAFYERHGFARSSMLPMRKHLSQPD